MSTSEQTASKISFLSGLELFRTCPSRKSKSLSNLTTITTVRRQGVLSARGNR